MRLIIICTIALFSLSACVKESEAAKTFKENCPYELLLNYPGHYLHFPMVVSPHQTTYRVGDTLVVSMIFSDSIYDANMGRRFKIPNYPVNIRSTLTKIDLTTDNWG